MFPAPHLYNHFGRTRTKANPPERYRYRFSLSLSLSLSLSFFVTKEQTAVGQEAVEHEEFVAHAVGGVTADGGADDET